MRDVSRLKLGWAKRVTRLHQFQNRFRSTAALSTVLKAKCFIPPLIGPSVFIVSITATKLFTFAGWNITSDSICSSKR